MIVAESYQGPVKVKHPELGECYIHPDFPGGKAALYIAAAGRRLGKALKGPAISTQVLPFVDTTTEMMKVYETQMTGDLDGISVQAWLRECTSLVDGSFAAYLVVVCGDGAIKATMSPDGDRGLKYEATGLATATENAPADILKSRLDAVIPPFSSISSKELAAELFG